MVSDCLGLCGPAFYKQLESPSCQQLTKRQSLCDGSTGKGCCSLQKGECLFCVAFQKPSKSHYYDHLAGAPRATLLFLKAQSLCDSIMQSLSRSTFHKPFCFVESCPWCSPSQPKINWLPACLLANKTLRRSYSREGRDVLSSSFTRPEKEGFPAWVSPWERDGLFWRRHGAGLGVLGRMLAGCGILAVATVLTRDPNGCLNTLMLSLRARSLKANRRFSCCKWGVGTVGCEQGASHEKYSIVSRSDK